MASLSHSSPSESIDKHPKKGEWSLEPMKRLCTALSLQPTQFRSVQVGGTNGKGSVTAMLSSILREGGFKVGAYFSPHLLDARERILVDGEKIPEKEFKELSQKVRDASAKLPAPTPSFFEQLTAIAFLYFERQKVDLVVAEVGMGGRLDATSLLAPLAAAITNVSIEHPQLLGSTVRQIAFEKAGIIKRGSAVATAAEGEALQAIAEKCVEEKGALYQIREKGLKIECSGEKTCFEFGGERYCTRLLGRHQALNAALAVKTTGLLREKNVFIEENAIQNGLLSVQLRGRLEVVSKKPLAVLDGAHNPAAARALALAVKELWPGKGVLLVSGVLRDKDAAGILKEFARLPVKKFFATAPKSERAIAASELAQKASPFFGSEKTTAEESIASALEKSLGECGKDEMILVAGSLYTVAEAIKYFEERKEKD